MDVDIQKPDTGYLSVIERPSSHPGSKFSTQAGPSPVKTPTGTLSTGGTNSPITLFGPYTEPLSEGEEDEDEIVAAKDEEDETKRTGLSAEEVKVAVAHREKMLKERKEEEEEARKREKKAGKDKDMGAMDENIEGEVSVGKNGKQPQLFRDTISRKLRTTALDINPLAPSSAFDETLKTKLAGAQEHVRLRGKPHRSSSRPKPSGEMADEANGLGGPSTQIDDDDRILERNWKAPKGKKIAVPVRIEPKVYFAAERTFLVCISF